MTLKEIQNNVDQWINKNGVRYFSELTNTTILMEEVGEFARIIARIYGEQSFKSPITEEEKFEKLEDELADILFVVTCLANQTKIDLTKAFIKNLEKKTHRDKNRHHANPKLND